MRDRQHPHLTGRLGYIFLAKVLVAAWGTGHRYIFWQEWKATVRKNWNTNGIQRMRQKHTKFEGWWAARMRAAPTAYRSSPEQTSQCGSASTPPRCPGKVSKRLLCSPVLARWGDTALGTKHALNALFFQGARRSQNGRPTPALPAQPKPSSATTGTRQTQNGRPTRSRLSPNAAGVNRTDGKRAGARRHDTEGSAALALPSLSLLISGDSASTSPAGHRYDSTSSVPFLSLSWIHAFLRMNQNTHWIDGKCLSFWNSGLLITVR